MADGSNLKQLQARQLAISAPPGLSQQIHYEVVMGSNAYGVTSDNSDLDVYGFTIPEKKIIFPHLQGVIPGFGQQGQHFDHWTQHHILDNQTNWDYTIYSIIRYFQLVSDGNPNMIDSLFVPIRCVLFMTPIGQLVRENRKLFISKKCWHTFKGYAYQQCSKMRNKTPDMSSKRRENFEKFGYDVKYAYHIVRLLNEVQQILEEGDLDLERSREQLKSIRRGEWTPEQIEEYFKSREIQLEKLYQDSKIPYRTDEPQLKQLLMNCLEQHFGNIGDAVTVLGREEQCIQEIKLVLDKYRV